VKEIWRTYLGTALQRVLEARSTADDDDALLDIEAAARRKAAAAATLGNYSPAGLGADNVHDAGKMLRGIVTLQRERFGAAHPTTGRAEAVHGMFLLWVNDRQGAFDAMLRALEIAKRAFGERHPNVAELYALLRAFGYEDVPDDTSHVLDDTAVAPAAPAAGPSADEDQEPEERYNDQGPSPADDSTTADAPPVTTPPPQSDVQEEAEAASAPGGPDVEEAAAEPMDETAPEAAAEAAEAAADPEIEAPTTEPEGEVPVVEETPEHTEAEAVVDPEPEAEATDAQAVTATETPEAE
jgi:hypothetical protein